MLLFASMLVILPVCKNDHHLAFWLAQWIAELGGCAKHQLHVLADDSADKHVPVEILNCLRGKFEMVDSSEMKAPDGWPIGANYMFRQAAMIAEKRQSHWYFFEPDNTPQDGWLDQLDEEYRMAGKSFMGRIEKHWLRGSSSQRIEDGEYLMGSAIYPWNLRSYTLQHLYPRDIPFDVAMRFDVARPLIHDTPLIQNLWRTHKYRIEGDEILCEAAPARSNQNGDSMVKPIDQSAAVIHGCKDSSLISILRNGKPGLLSAADAEKSSAAV